MNELFNVKGKSSCNYRWSRNLGGKKVLLHILQKKVQK